MTDLFLLIPQSDKNVVRLRFYTGELFNWLAYNSVLKSSAINVIGTVIHVDQEGRRVISEPRSLRDHVEWDLASYLPVISWLLDGLHSGCT